MLRIYRNRAVILRGIIAVVATLVFVGLSMAQAPTPTPGPPQKDADKLPAAKDKIARWFEIEQLSAAMRYHFIENDNKRKAANNNQYQFIAKLRFKFDKKGKYSIDTNLATGSSFTTFWNATGWGTGSPQKNLNLRQLYFDAKPNKAVQIQFGGVYVNYGEGTESITYDSDGYITGERIQIRAPKKLYFDEISVTYASVGDINRPNVFRRFEHLDVQNHHQFLVRKQFTKHIGFSADYTFESGIDTLHQAVKIKIPHKHFIDTFLFENYERLDPDHNYGFNVFGEKRLNEVFTASGGFADIHIKMLNGDRFPPGKRVYLTGQMKLSPEFSLSLLFTQGVGPIMPNVARTRLDVILNYNILETLRRTRLF